MVDDKAEDIEPSQDSGRPRRPPPTIDLEPSEVTGETRTAGADAEPERISREPSVPISPWVIAPVSGAVAASLVICVGWILGWPPVLPTTSVGPPSNAAIVDDLAARLASIEARTGKPAAPSPDPAMAGRVEALEKSLASLRGEISGLRAQSEKLAAAVNDAKSTPRESAPSVDLSAITERLSQIERTVLVLYHQEERTYEEIANVLSLPIGTVRTHLHRSRKKLREGLQERQINERRTPCATIR